MDLSIIIPTKERGEVFEETLRSAMKAIDGMEAEIIVINDSKVLRPVVPVAPGRVRLIDNPKAGVASARNLGAAKAQSEILIFMDDDFLVERKDIVRAVEIAALDTKKIHLFNWVYPPDLQETLGRSQFGRYLIRFGFTTLQGWLAGEWRNEDVFELEGGASYFLPIAKSLFNDIGGYNENFPHAGAEDYEFVQKARKAGVRFYLDKTVTLYHNEKDRLDMKNWMRRKERNGETLKVAAGQGLAEIAIYYPNTKRFVLKMLSKSKSLFFAALNILPNVTWLDPVYFRITNVLLAIHIFDGYSKEEPSK